MSTNLDRLKLIIEGALLAAGRPLSIDHILSLFLDEDQPTREEIREALDMLQADCENRGVELKEVASGFRFQVKSDFAPWVSRLWEEKPARYSRATLETLALIAYRQPITRSEIEDVRGVSVSSTIIKSLLEREWVRVVGHRDVPGKPALYGTTKGFLDYFNLKSLSELPPLAELRNIESIEQELDFGKMEKGEEGESPEADSEQQLEIGHEDDKAIVAAATEVGEEMAQEAAETVAPETEVLDSSDSEGALTQPDEVETEVRESEIAEAEPEAVNPEDAELDVAADAVKETNSTASDDHIVENEVEKTHIEDDKEAEALVD